MKHKTAELEGAQLDAAVAKAIGKKYVDISSDGKRRWAGVNHQDQEGGFFSPSTDWAEGGPVFERHYSQITAQLLWWFGDDWTRKINAVVSSDVLVWFMRAFVASKFGDEVELP